MWLMNPCELSVNLINLVSNLQCSTRKHPSRLLDRVFFNSRACFLQVGVPRSRGGKQLGHVGQDPITSKLTTAISFPINANQI